MRNYYFIFRIDLITQLVEYYPFKIRVASSNLAGITKNKFYNQIIMIETIKQKIKELESKKFELEVLINNEEKLLKEEIAKESDLVKGLAEYIKYKNYPTELYNTFGRDFGEYDNFKDIRLKIVYNYGYTDVVGLTDEQFEQLNDLFN